MERVSAGLILLLTSGLAAGAEQPLSLAGAEIVATHPVDDRPSPVANAFDGDDETCWAGDGHDLRGLATNLIVTLPQPAVVGAVEVVTQVLKDRLRLTRLEVYAGGEGDQWLLLGSVESNNELRFRLDLAVCRTSRLRFRVRDTAREDHAWPRINELRLLAAAPDAQPADLRPGVADETTAERYFLRRALHSGPPAVLTTFDPAKGYPFYVTTFVDTLLEHGTDRYGPVQGPLWVSLLDTATLAHPNAELPPIPGQRPGDRAMFGGNLQHDIPLLLACDGLDRLRGGTMYHEAAEAYLSHFLKTCTGTATGLWPWGEHAHWDFYRDAPGHNTHEYLGAAPFRFWARLWRLDPEAVRREADGLVNHIVNLETFDYNRHADIAHPLAVPRPPNDSFLDFPRHGGLYLQVWSFVSSQTGDAKYLDLCDRMMDHHLRARHPETGLLPQTTTRDQASFGLATQLSLAVSMLEAAPLLGDTATGKRCAELGRAYLDALLRLPHRPEEGKFVQGCPVAGLQPGQPVPYSSPGFTEIYGGGDSMGGVGLLWCQAYRLTSDERCLALAKGIGEFYAAHDMPHHPDIRAAVYADTINLLLDLRELLQEDRWRQAADRYGRDAVEQLYCNGLFRGATGLWYYDSELFPGTLAYALLRLADPACLPPLYYHR